MDYSTLTTPQAIYDYLTTQLPDLKQPDSGYTRLVNYYLLGIGTYYEQQLISRPGEEPCPRCTLENVLATVLHHDSNHVLAMLETHPLSAAFVPLVLEAYYQGDLKQVVLKQVAGVIAYTQFLLGGLAPGAVASKRVDNYLHRFVSIS